MKKSIKLLGTLALFALFTVGCSRGPEMIKTEPITDQAVIDELAQIANTSIVKYFPINTEDGVPRKLDAFENQVLTDEQAGTYEPNTLIVKYTAEGEPQPGQLYSYGVSMDPVSKEVKGAIMIEYSDAPIKEYTLEQLQEMAMSFIKDKEIVADPAQLTYLETDKTISSKEFTALRYGYGEDFVVVTISLQTGNVTHFEYIVPFDTPAK